MPLLHPIVLLRGSFSNCSTLARGYEAGANGKLVTSRYSLLRPKKFFIPLRLQGTLGLFPQVKIGCGENSNFIASVWPPLSTPLPGCSLVCSTSVKVTQTLPSFTSSPIIERNFIAKLSMADQTVISQKKKPQAVLEFMKILLASPRRGI